MIEKQLCDICNSPTYGENGIVVCPICDREPGNPTDRNISPKLQEEIDEKRKEAEGLTDETLYLYIFSPGECRSFKEMRNFFITMGYTIQRSFTHKEYLENIPEDIRHTCIMRETLEDHMKRKELEKNGKDTSKIQ